MKLFFPATALSLLLITGSALASDPPKVSTTTQADHPMDMKGMDMKGMDMSKDQGGDDFSALDKNKDGKLSKDEVPAKHPLAPHFGMLDTNHDGSLSKAEFAAAHSK